MSGFVRHVRRKNWPSSSVSGLVSQREVGSSF